MAAPTRGRCRMMCVAVALAALTCDGLPPRRVFTVQAGYVLRFTILLGLLAGRVCLNSGHRSAGGHLRVWAAGDSLRCREHLRLPTLSGL